MENARNLFVDCAPAPAGPDRGIRTMLGSLPSLVPTSSLPIGYCHLALDSNGTNHRKNVVMYSLSVSSDSERNRVGRDWNLRMSVCVCLLK